ncbi:hypothetical protein GJ496_000766 [Pomphorhynchus laevis]|nr:hypothetical protein GJ496_000766 [Pomphorhynchus laevis]
MRIDETITVPCEMYDELKIYVKEALKQKPENLLQWSFNYFQARLISLPSGSQQLSKTHVDSQEDNLIIASPSHLFKLRRLRSLYRLIYNQNKHQGPLYVDELEKMWKNEGLDNMLFQQTKQLVCQNKIKDIRTFIAGACTFLATNIEQSVAFVIETLYPESNDHDTSQGDYSCILTKSILFDDFAVCYRYLAHLDNSIPPDYPNTVIEYIQKSNMVNSQGFVRASDIFGRHIPKLQPVLPK